MERGKREFPVVKAQVGRLPHGPCPRAHPAPKWLFRMSLEPPLRGFPVHAPSRAVVLVVLEKPVEHVHVPHIAKGFGAGAEFGVVVGRGGRGSQKAVGHFEHERRDVPTDRPVEAFEDRAVVD